MAAVKGHKELSPPTNCVINPNTRVLWVWQSKMIHLCSTRWMKGVLIWFWEDWKWHSYSSIHPMKVSWEHRGHPSSPSSPGNWSWLPQWQQLYIFFVSVTQCNWYTKRQTMWRTKLNISIHVSVGWFIYGGSYRHCEVAARIFSRPVSRCSQAAWFCGLLHVRRGARVMFNFPHSESIPSTFGLAL